MKNVIKQLFAVISVAVVLCAVVSLTSAQTINVDRVVTELEPEIQRTLLAGNIPSVSIALVSNDRVIWSNAYGYSNLWARTPATTNTVYLIGSTFKTMSTVALLQLMEQGKFKLDDPVNKYLTDFTLIGYLVQKFSGVPYKQYIQEHIFAPMEMTSTAFEPRPDMDERLSIPYVVDQKTGGQVGAVRVKASVWPAGIVYGTVLNQANWLICNLNGGVFKEKRLISEDTLNQMFTRQYDQFKGGIEGIWGNETAGFGLTWWTQVRDGDRYFAHSGSVAGYTAFLLGNRDRKLGFAILTNGNRAHPHLFKLADKAIDLMKKYSSTTGFQSPR
jgi:CubicO group peptidase (beta-lactamase class C family)